jgi:uncharacterized protein YqjF (DUF2071 family)
MRAPPAQRAVMRQLWQHLGFLHWPIDADAVARLLPPGLGVDTFGGTAYVGIVPFTIPLSRSAMFGVKVAPAFHELNLRTYVHRAGHDPGVWFFSLDAASRLAVWGARFGYHLPYFHARMSMVVSGDGHDDAPVVAYESIRAWNGAAFRARYQATGPAAPAAAGSLEFFLVERYLLYAWNGRELRAARVHHIPYPVQPATATEVSQTLTPAASLPATAGPPTHVCYAREVDVRIFAPRRLDNPTRVR